MHAPTSAAASAPTRYCLLMAANSRKKAAAIAAMPPLEAVHVVQQVQRVGDADDPHQRHGDVEPAARANDADPHVGDHQDARSQELPASLTHGTEAAPVVPQPQERHQRRAEEDAGDLVDVEPVAQR